MSTVKRERWTEADVDALPAGEHDYFERKGGALLNEDRNLVEAKLAKAVSAMSNSGGGHVLLGVADDGTPDGVPPIAKGRTSTRDWLEQVVPRLVSYPLSDFRVHVVEPAAAGSRIPAGRQVIVIDIGDSALAPHQCARGGADATEYVYYHRQAGRSVPAPHFYVELLRQRLVSPTLVAEVNSLDPVDARAVAGGAFAALRLRFVVRNTGRVAAYKWQLRIDSFGGVPDDRDDDYRLPPRYPVSLTRRSGGVRVDDTILPGCSLGEDVEFGVRLRVPGRDATRFIEETRADLEALLNPLIVRCQLATETSPGEVFEVALSPLVDANWLAGTLAGYLRAQ